jgi:uncharacterized protein
MNKSAILKATKKHVRKTLEGEGSGHDWWHIYRVWMMSKRLAKGEKADMFVVELAALLHDIADWKFNKGRFDIGPKIARAWLEKLKVDEAAIAHVCEIVKNISFKGAGVKNLINTKEGMVVQDADRLDAMGAIGIARAFAYGGYAGRTMYDPEIKSVKHRSFAAYKNAKSGTINHFYEKLLLLKDRMNTKTAKKIAAARHKFMEQYLDHFYKEWEGKE